MTIEHPRFPTPDDVRRAAMLWQALLANVGNDALGGTQKDAKKPGEPGSGFHVQ